MIGSKLVRYFMLLVIFVSLPISLYLLGRQTGFFSRAFGTNANLVVDMGASFNDSHFVWQNFAQGGEEKGRMLAPVVAKVKPLKPQYIRIDHIYDFYNVVSRDGGQLNFNFTELDKTVDDILATGAKPFFSLSYMPSILSSGSEVDNPTNWQEWQLLVQKTIEHYSGTGGYKLSGVYYEVWNEPDLFGGYKTYGDKNYLELYRHSAIGAARAQNVLPFKFGGPATTALYQNWVTGLAAFTKANNLRLDFYSWHTYTFDLDRFEKDIFDVRNWLADHLDYSQIELIISEIGPDSKNNKVYDNSFSAIHTIATAAVLEDTASKMFSFEIKDGPGPSQYWERWGMFTHEKYGDPVAKPRVSAFNFLNNLQGARVNVIGEGSWVKAFAKKLGKVTKILIVNYDPDNKHFEAVPVNIVNVPPNFTFKRTDYGTGVIRQVDVATTSATWATVEGMNPNSATILEITEK